MTTQQRNPYYGQTMSYLDAPDYDESPSLVMTPDVARALIDADADGTGMAEALIEKAYFVAFKEILDELKSVDNYMQIAYVIIRLNISPKSQVDGTNLAINYMSQGLKCPHCHKLIERSPFHKDVDLRKGHTALFVHDRCYILNEGTREQKREYYAKQVLQGKVRKGGKR